MSNRCTVSGTSGLLPKLGLAALVMSMSLACGIALADSPELEGVCFVNLIVSTGESCTYPGTSDEFTVDSDGKGTLPDLHGPRPAER